jgi:hypothetical protein
MRRTTATTGARRRAKVSVSVDAALLAAVDSFVAARSGVDRSGVFDAALRLWCADQLDAAMAAQYARPDGVDPLERAAWNAIRDAAAARTLGPADRTA